MCPGCLDSLEPLDTEYACISCHTPFQNRFPLDAEGKCALCRAGARGFDAAYCFGFYEGPLRDLIHLYKYGGVRTLSKPLSGLLETALPRRESFDLVTAVPLHWRRQWQRGFNQSELLARAIARRSGLPFMRALKRVRWTDIQAGLSNTRRRRNVSGAFACRRPAKVRGRRILLIDDVMTTGATAAACASVLKRAGARRIAVLAVARVDRRYDGGRAAAAH